MREIDAGHKPHFAGANRMLVIQIGGLQGRRGWVGTPPETFYIHCTTDGETVDRSRRGLRLSQPIHYHLTKKNCKERPRLSGHFVPDLEAVLVVSDYFSAGNKVLSAAETSPVLVREA